MDSETKDPAQLNPPDPKSGKPFDFQDMREEFERLSRQTPRDPEAEHAFIQSKIEIIRTDPHLTEEEKTRAISELQRAGE